MELRQFFYLSRFFGRIFFLVFIFFGLTKLFIDLFFKKNNINNQTQIKKCTSCSKEVHLEATECNHCGSMLSVSGADLFTQQPTKNQGNIKGKLNGIGYISIGIGFFLIGGASEIYFLTGTSIIIISVFWLLKKR